MDEEKTASIAIWLLMLVLFVPAIMLGAWAVSVQWGWFVVPLGARSINWAEACGLDLILMLILRSRGIRQDDPDESAASKLIRFLSYSFCAPLFLLGVSYVVHFSAAVSP